MEAGKAAKTKEMPKREEAMFPKGYEGALSGEKARLLPGSDEKRRDAL